MSTPTRCTVITLSAAAALTAVPAFSDAVEATDAELLEMFRRWAEAQTNVYDLTSWADDDAYRNAHDKADALIDEIFFRPSRDATGWAIKTFLRMHVMYGPTLKGPLDIAVNDESDDFMLKKIDSAMWAGRRGGDVVGRKTFGLAMGRRFRAVKANVIWYCDVAFRPDEAA